MNELINKSYTTRHRLISFFRDIDLKGFRKLSILLPSWLLPNPKSIGEHIIKTIHGFKMIINPSIDNGVELSLFQTGTYERGILDFINKNYNPKGLFVDVGANIGLMSVFTASAFKNGNIIAIEAHPVTANILKRNIEINSLSNIVIKEIALGNEVGETQIFENWQVNRGGASLVVHDENSKSYPVKIEKLDNIITDTVSIIKIDVEGLELDVLKGASNTILKCKPILIVEISDQRTSTLSPSNEIVDFINEFGFYKLYKLKGGKERRSKLIEILSNDDLPMHDNIICIAKN